MHNPRILIIKKLQFVIKKIKAFPYIKFNFFFNGVIYFEFEIFLKFIQNLVILRKS